MIEPVDICRILDDRPRYYADPDLERKRQAAIAWLRTRQRGWVLDHPVQRVWGAAIHEDHPLRHFDRTCQACLETLHEKPE